MSIPDFVVLKQYQIPVMLYLSSWWAFKIMNEPNSYDRYIDYVKNGALKFPKKKL